MLTVCHSLMPSTGRLLSAQVTILNADNGAHFHFVDHSLVSNLVVGVTGLRNQINDPHQPNGHHPLTLYHGHYNLITGAHINATYSHE